MFRSMGLSDSRTAGTELHLDTPRERVIDTSELGRVMVVVGEGGGDWGGGLG